MAKSSVKSENKDPRLKFNEKRTIIEGVDINLKSSVYEGVVDIESLKKTEVFSSVPKEKQDEAYEKLLSIIIKK